MTRQPHTRVSGWYAMLVALVGLLIAASAGAEPTRATVRLAKPRTLVIQHGPIYKFAQDGDFITWVGGRHYVVHLRSVSGRSSWVLGNAGVGAAVGAQSASTLVLGGKRAVWVKYAGVMSREAGIYTAKPGQKKPMILDNPAVTEYGGTYLTGRRCRRRTDDRLRRCESDVRAGERQLVTRGRWSPSLRPQVVPASNPWHSRRRLRSPPPSVGSPSSRRC